MFGFSKSSSANSETGSVEEKTQVTLSLISHTNVGKTTLARTLLGRDVGEIKDEAHVTDISEAHLMLETGAEKLLLWDTPGFGDSVRLLKRLKGSEQPIVGFLKTTWDRFRDRPLWCSQQAIANVKEEADLVLYLVNASMWPEETPYVRMELQILQWMNKPVIVLLNQTGRATHSELKVEIDRWREVLKEYEVVRDVQQMDAFARCWVQEDVLLENLAQHVSPEKSSAMQRLAAAWKEQNSERFEKSCQLLAELLLDSALERREVESGTWVQQIGLDRGKVDREMKQARTDLAKSLGDRFAICTDDLIALHQLKGQSAASIASLAVDNFGLPEKVSEPLWTAVGGAAAGVTAGVAADILSGGLTLGGGAIVGGLTGGAGALLLAKGFNLSKGDENALRWSEGHFHEQWRRSLLAYLAVAHFGRGRGQWVEGDPPSFWVEAIDKVIQGQRSDISKLWREAGKIKVDQGNEKLQKKAREIVQRSLSSVLSELYPD